MPRPRLTIGRSMGAIAFIAVGLTMYRFLPFVVIVVLAGLALWVAAHAALGVLVARTTWWCARRLGRAWRVLMATSCLLIVWMSFLGIIFVYAGYNAEHLLLGVTIVFPLVVGTMTWSYHDFARPYGPRAVAERAILWNLVGLAIVCVVGNLPFHLAFAVSRPALDRIADQAEAAARAGGYVDPHMRARAGLFTVGWARLEPTTGEVVGLGIEDHGGSILAFVASPHFCRARVPLDRMGGAAMAYRPGDVPLGGGWYYKYWGQFVD